MINRYSLAVFIPILLATNTVNAVNIFNKHGNKLEIYGCIHPNHQFFHTLHPLKMHLGDDNSNSNFGILAKSQITDNFFGYAQLEYGVNLFFPEKILSGHINHFLRLGYAGIQYGNLGSVDYGRNNGVMHDAQSLVDHTPYITNNSMFSYNDRYMMNRNNSLLTYSNSNFFGLIKGFNFKLQYQDKNTDRDVSQQNDLGWGASFTYKSNMGLTAVGSVFSSKIPDKSSHTPIKKKPVVDVYGLGVKYDTGHVYLAGFYGISKNLIPDYIYKDRAQPYINSTENIEAIAEYKFSSGFCPSLSFLESRGKNFNSVNFSFNGEKSELIRQVTFATRYQFNKNVSAYVNYKINLLKKNHSIVMNNIFEDNMISAGMTYQF